MVKLIHTDETLTLRNRVLRAHLPLEQCRFPNDEHAFHLGYFLNAELISIATFFEEDYPGLGKGGYRLRGMATAPDQAGKGYGAEVIKFAIDELKKRGAAYIWCNARSTALGFYLKLNFEILSEEFEISGIGAHFNMSLQLNR